jgi:hypothetical protein
MEHLGELAAESESEDEAAEHFAPLVKMAARKILPKVLKAAAPAAKKAAPKIARVLVKATPHLTKKIATVAKALHRHPNTRHLLKTVPAIARRTVGNLAHRAVRGGHITPRTAAHVVARQARRVLGTPQHRAQALRLHKRLEHKFHQHARGGGVHPHLRYGYGRPGVRGYRVGGAAPIGHAVSGSRAISGTGAPRRYTGVRGPGMSTRVAGGPSVRYGATGSKGCGCGHCCCCGGH